MESRPKLKIALSKADWVMESLGWLLVFLVWGYVIYNYQTLPETIPTHFNILGEADGFGDKGMILTLPAVASILFIGMTILNKFPHVFNYPTDLTANNVLRQYTLATRLIRYLKVSIVFLFGLTSFETISIANGYSEGLGIWFLPLTLGLIFIPLIYFLIQSSQSSSEGQP